MAVVFIFPGQNSRYPSMLEKLLACDPASGHWLDRASEVLGRDLRRHFRSSNAGMFAHNRDIQIGVFLASHMHWQVLEKEGVHADYSAGLSLGEYNHLVHIGAMSFEDALRVLKARGEAYEDGPKGKMAAVLPITEEELGGLVKNSGYAGVVSIGMLNTPRQCVLSGDAAGVDVVSRSAQDVFLTETIAVDDRLPMHSSLFRSVGTRLASALQHVSWRKPGKPYLPNVTGQFSVDSSTEFFVDALSRHTWNTVRWRESMETLWQAAPGATFVEIGPRSVLTNFFGRKWLSPQRFSTDSDENFELHLTTLIRELKCGSARA